MKQTLKPIVVSLCLSGLMALPVYAETGDQTAEQMQASETQQPVVHKKKHAKKHHAKKHHAKKLVSSADNNEDQISGPQDLPTKGDQYLPVDVKTPGQSFVSTGPYIGVPLQYSGSNLIVNHPSINQDVSLLNLRKNINTRVAEKGIKAIDEHSHLLLSGAVEGQANYKKPGNQASTSDLDVTNVVLDAYILGPSSWTSGLISLSYENNIGSQTGSLSSNSRTQNSRVYVNKAFIVIGDFAQSPFYGTIGQLYVPFGTYSTTMVSSPLTKLLARVQARAVVLGYQQQDTNAFYGSAYAFKGDSTASTANRINNGGLNAGYKFEQGDYSGNFGAGVIANIADSQGMQNTGNGATVNGIATSFGGFGGTSGTGSETLVHRVPAYNLRGIFSIGKTVDLIAEYVAATTRFNSYDLTMKDHGARPQALNAEAAYTFQSLAKPTSVGVGYGMTKDALALGLPAQRYSLVGNTSLWRNTLQSIEFRHDINYAANTASSGSGLAGPSASGKSDNIITAQFDIYF